MKCKWREHFQKKDPGEEMDQSKDVLFLWQVVSRMMNYEVICQLFRTFAKTYSPWHELQMPYNDQSLLK
jgi:hypothetical protein